MSPARARVVTSRATGPDLMDLFGPFLLALLGGEEKAAEELVAAARSRGADTAFLVRDLVTPALREVGRMWTCGEASVAEEHLATILASRVLARSAGASRASTVSRRIVLACLEGEFHDVGLGFLADIARECGWDPESLGANVPREALVRFVEQRPPAALALSVSLAAHVPEAARAIARVRAVAPGITVVVGGRALCEDTARVSLTGADAGICDAVAFRDWLVAAAKRPRGRTEGGPRPKGLPSEMPPALRRRCRCPN